jgi:hypothetical protein
MKKEELIKSFQALTMEDKMEFIRVILPEFCQSFRQQPEARQGMMQLMIKLCEQNMSEMMDWMRMMNMRK